MSVLEQLATKYPPLLTQKHVEEITGLSSSTLEQARINGKLFPFVRLNSRIRYPLAELAECLENLPRFRSITEADANTHKKTAA